MQPDVSLLGSPLLTSLPRLPNKISNTQRSGWPHKISREDLNKNAGTYGDLQKAQILMIQEATHKDTMPILGGIRRQDLLTTLQ